jgi:methionyl-tRNA formyltransferase
MLKTIFMGTPEIAVPCLESLAQNKLINLIKVISMPDRPFGRDQKLKTPEVAAATKEHQLPLLQIENINQDPHLLDLLKQADLVIVFAFAQFLNEKILNAPKLGCFNIHTSLLPKFRGAAPIQAAILAGEKQTGVTIQKMVKKMDAGDIALQKIINISNDETGDSLYQKLKILSVAALAEFIEQLTQNKIRFIPQDESQISFAPILSREDGFLDFKNSDAISVLRKIRAFHSWPGSYCFLGDKRMKVFKAITSPLKLSPGKTEIVDNTLNIGCKDLSIRLIEIQLEGKKVCHDSTLLNGMKKESLVINP